jgi:hypothetical protein
VVALGKVRPEAMGIARGRSLAVSLLFVLLIVAVILVDQILELADFVFEMACLDLGFLELFLECLHSGSRSQ